MQQNTYLYSKFASWYFSEYSIGYNTNTECMKNHENARTTIEMAPTNNHQHFLTLWDIFSN